jgi:quinol monooxygenase YgiN
MFCETWKDDASLKAHNEMLEFKKFIPHLDVKSAAKIIKII